MAIITIPGVSLSSRMIGMGMATLTRLVLLGPLVIISRGGSSKAGILHFLIKVTDGTTIYSGFYLPQKQRLRLKKIAWERRWCGNLGRKHLLFIEQDSPSITLSNTLYSQATLSEWQPEGDRHRTYLPGLERIGAGEINIVRLWGKRELQSVHGVVEAGNKFRDLAGTDVGDLKLAYK